MATMTGEKIRAMRKEQPKPNRNGEIAGAYEESSDGTGPRLRSNRAFLKASARRQQQQQLNANHINGNPPATEPVLSDDNKNPMVATGDGHFPVHECVYRADVRRLSSLIRTHSITKKDVHGDPSAFPHVSPRCWVVMRAQAHLCCLFCRKHPSAPGGDAGPQR